MAGYGELLWVQGFHRGWHRYTEISGEPLSHRADNLRAGCAVSLSEQIELSRGRRGRHLASVSRDRALGTA